MPWDVTIAGCTRAVDVRSSAAGFTVLLDGEPLACDLVLIGPCIASLLIPGENADRSITLTWARTDPTRVWVGTSGGAAGDAWADIADPRRTAGRGRFEHSGRARLQAAMAGKVVRLLVAPGATVEAGQPVLVLEAMKMQNEVRSPKSGIVASLAVAAGETVATGQILAEIE